MSLLERFLNFSADRDDLVAEYGRNLTPRGGTPMVVTAEHVAAAIDKFMSGEIDVARLTDWVNVLWFFDLYDYSDSETDAIASVMDVLETLDEPGVTLTEAEARKMKECLRLNREYHG
ncbi:MAG: hypothetical protein J6X38_00485 [Abditibacteriota bacterium]|nr:hypothetical protein [Abditibacteriota bacterium]